MSILYNVFELVDKFWPAKKAYAHCDIPCGIYDPHTTQIAAHTVIRMTMLIDELTANMKTKPNPSVEERRDFVHKLSRYTATKEEHAEICKKEIRILWGDYFKPEHAQKFSELHELVFKAMKQASKVRQETSIQAAEELLVTINQIAEIFWKTKGKETVRIKAPYPTERETVYPKL